MRRRGKKEILGEAREKKVVVFGKEIEKTEKKLLLNFRRVKLFIFIFWFQFPGRAKLIVVWVAAPTLRL